MYPLSDEIVTVKTGIFADTIPGEFLTANISDYKAATIPRVEFNPKAAEDMATVDPIALDLVDFLNASPTNFHAVGNPASPPDLSL